MQKNMYGDNEMQSDIFQSSFISVYYFIYIYLLRGPHTDEDGKPSSSFLVLQILFCLCKRCIYHSLRCYMLHIYHTLSALWCRSLSFTHTYASINPYVYSTVIKILRNKLLSESLLSECFVINYLVLHCFL